MHELYTNVAFVINRLVQLIECVKILTTFDMDYVQGDNYQINAHYSGEQILTIKIYVGESKVEISIKNVCDLLPILKMCSYTPVSKIAQLGV